jgi:hypothetical protein
MKVSDKTVRVHMRAGKSLNYEHRAVGWLKYAADHGFNGLVLLIDQDGQKDREAGLAAAQSNSLFELPRAMGVAVQAFDAWMLADETALTQAFKQVVNRQPAPETIANPKGAFQQLMHELGPQTTQTDLYLASAKLVNIDVLLDRCPRGFKTFYERLRTMRSF